jgi:hypothetical protein
LSGLHCAAVVMAYRFAGRGLASVLRSSTALRCAVLLLALLGHTGHRNPLPLPLSVDELSAPVAVCMHAWLAESHCINASAHCRTFLHSGCGGEAVSSSSGQGALPSAAAAGLHSWAAAADASAGSRQPSGHDGPPTCGPQELGWWASQPGLPAGRRGIHTSSGLCCSHPRWRCMNLRGQPVHVFRAWVGC